MALVSTNEGKYILKKYEEMWSKIRDLVRPITNWDDYDEKYNLIDFGWWLTSKNNKVL